MKIAVKLALIPLVAMLGWAVIRTGATTHDSVGSDSDVASLAKYREWTLVNPTPQVMDPIAAVSCLSPISARGGPHTNKYVSVYVNSIGKDAMMTMVSSKFPIGSMIVKEKLARQDSEKPELLTAMIKREVGYYPQGGDWEYLLINGTATEVQERGKLDYCAGCHAPYKGDDFVTRIYLPRSVRANLK